MNTARKLRNGSPQERQAQKHPQCPETYSVEWARGYVVGVAGADFIASTSPYEVTRDTRRQGYHVERREWLKQRAGGVRVWLSAAGEVAQA